MPVKTADPRNGERRILTPKQAANFCGVHPATVVRWIDQGKLKAYRTPGGHRRIFLRDLQTLMAPYGLLPGDEVPARAPVPARAVGRAGKKK